MAGRAGSIRGFVMPAREKREMYRNREMYREFPRFLIHLREGGAEMYRLDLKCIAEFSRHAPHAVAPRAGELSKRDDLRICEASRRRTARGEPANFLTNRVRGRCL